MPSAARTRSCRPGHWPNHYRRVASLLSLLPLALTSGALAANPPVDEVKNGRCLEMKVDGRVTPCNSDMRFVDDGKGTVHLVSGYGDSGVETRTVMSFKTTQAPDMENAYGYALRVTNVTLMPSAAPERQRHSPATGLCFLVKPHPMRVVTKAIRQDIVVPCSATLNDEAAHVRKLDWKFVF